MILDRGDPVTRNRELIDLMAAAISAWTKVVFLRTAVRPDVAEVAHECTPPTDE
jgi:hypothetical protein